jgi:CheY-like chemotaxis protein
MAKSSRHILIIDDDPNIRMLLGYVLRKHFRVTTQDDGLSAMSWLADGNLPDLILADLDMPRLNGYAFLRNLRDSGFFRDIPVVMLSGYDAEEVQEKCLAEGANGYLIKPFNPDLVKATIEAVLAVKE